jgi:prepilin-type N-terminal cleavage/methylation domain-containing protein
MFSHCAKRAGFTLTELIIVVTIIGILVSIAIPRLTATAQRSRVQRLFADLRTLQTAADQFDAEHSVKLGKTTSNTNVTGPVVRDRLMNNTNLDGSINTAGKFGPYVFTWPVNAINERPGVAVSTLATGAATRGWRLDPETSLFTPSAVGGKAVVLGVFERSGYTVDIASGAQKLNGTLQTIGGP